MGQDQQALEAFVVLVEAAQDAVGNELAQRGAGVVDILAVAEVRLLVQKASAVDEQTIDWDVSVVTTYSG